MSGNVLALAVCCLGLAGRAAGQDVTFSGDLRWRHESIDDETAAETRNRDRVRARIGLDVKASDDLTLRFRLATGGTTDPVSTNQTLDDAAANKGFNLDYAYADWKFGSCGAALMAGKMKNPFFKPAKNSLIWDGDLTPEGLVFAWKMGGEGDVRPFVTATYFWYNEVNPGDDVTMLGLQAGVKAGGLTAGAGLYGLSNIEGTAALGNGLEGNTDGGGGTYATGFNEIEVFAEYSVKVGASSVPVTIGADFVTNSDADDLNTGWLVGVTVGKCKEPGSWQLAVNYRSLEADCTLGTWTDSDHFGGGTDGEGLGVSFGYQMAEKSKLGVTYLVDTKDPEGAATNYDRLQFDLGFKF